MSGLGNYSTDPGGFYIYEEGANSYRFTIQKGGNVGIGSKNPSAKLDVDGSFNIASGNTVSGIPVTRFQQHYFLDVYYGHNQSYTFDFEHPIIDAYPVLMEFDLLYGPDEEHTIQRIKAAVWGGSISGSKFTVYCGIDACNSSGDRLHAKKIGCVVIASVKSVTSV